MFSEYFAIKNNTVAICSRLVHFRPYIDWTNIAFLLLILVSKILSKYKMTYLPY